MTITIRLRYLVLAALGLMGIQSAMIPIAVAFARQGNAEPAANSPLGNGFTYQGRLEQDGLPSSGAFDFEFRLFDQAADGAEVAAMVPAEDVQVTNGLFSVTLAFPGAFEGSRRFLEVRTRPGASVDPNEFEMLTRQELTATPYALFAKSIPLAGDGTSEAAAHSDHDHVGQVWAGTVNPLLAFQRSDIQSYVEIGSNLAGVLGLSPGGSSCGIINSPSAAGVWGVGCDSGQAGVAGVSVDGTGVHGNSANGSGVVGLSRAQFGYGVVGIASRFGADGVGVAGFSGEFTGFQFAPTETGVYGYAAVSNSTGVFGRAAGTDAAAIRGFAETSSTWAGRFTGKVEIAGVLTNPSDQRLKHAIEPLAYGMDEVLALSPVTYVLNGDESEQVRYGLVAQEVQSILPDLVMADGDGMLSLNYLDLIPVLIRAIQEQQAEIDALRSGAGAQ